MTKFLSISKSRLNRTHRKQVISTWPGRLKRQRAEQGQVEGSGRSPDTSPLLKSGLQSLQGYSK